MNPLIYRPQQPNLQAPATPARSTSDLPTAGKALPAVAGTEIRPHSVVVPFANGAIEALELTTANAGRTYLLIQNRGAIAVLIGFDRSPVDSQGNEVGAAFWLPAGDTWHPNVAPTNRLLASCIAAGTSRVLILEGFF